MVNKIKTTWIVEAGCTQHMCNERKLFTTLEEMREPKNMIMGNGEVLEVTEKGSVGLRVLTNQGSGEGTF